MKITEVYERYGFMFIIVEGEPRVVLKYNIPSTQGFIIYAKVLLEGKQFDIKDMSPFLRWMEGWLTSSNKPRELPSWMW